MSNSGSQQPAKLAPWPPQWRYTEQRREKVLPRPLAPRKRNSGLGAPEGRGLTACRLSGTAVGPHHSPPPLSLPKCIDTFLTLGSRVFALAALGICYSLRSDFLLMELE